MLLTMDLHVCISNLLTWYLVLVAVLWCVGFTGGIGRVHISYGTHCFIQYLGFECLKNISIIGSNSLHSEAEIL